MNSPAVQALCLALWQARGEGVYLDGVRLSRELHVACAADVAASETYVPEQDARVEWARQVITKALYGHRGPSAEADASTEACVALLLGHLVPDPEPLLFELPRRLPCGKDRAAGD